ncbi:3'-5' exonuclease [Rhodoferax sp.]|uniref:3'-5' exonuclease n=1 Tax=Rhodoferax sp. TaxID=50421 RepID=UPI002725F54E|nr:3'-5' exonuclease [Rhodoferax sp.]MDO9196679.1 3'-5' exonuclease [Rhodoferax sp.]
MTDSQLQLGFDTADMPVALGAKPKTRPKPRSVAATQAAPLPDAETMAAALARHPDYRVLRRLVPVHHFDQMPQGSLIRVLVLDTETTGLDQSRDKIIELAMLQVDVDVVTGLPVGDVAIYDGLEDPGIPISSEIQAITGISSEMVRGHRLDEARIAAMLQGADLVIAHNAGFDRPFCEARIAAFAQLPWSCSFVDIDWKKEGHGSSKLEYLAMEKGRFYEAHRAEVDCHALLAVLGEKLPTSSRTGLAQLIAASRLPSYRLQATSAPFDAKDLLKARAYRWNAEQKVWHTRLDSEAQLTAELEWLKSAVYGNRPARVQVEKLDAAVKYSSRAGELSNRQI